LNKRILLVGNFLSASNGIRGVGEELSLHLQDNNWRVITSSDQVNKLARIADMLYTSLKYRSQYALACIEVYSGSAFVWAVLVSRVIKQLRKPYILALHGGNLPSFSQRWPGMVQSLLESANIVTTPSFYLSETLSDFRNDIQLLPNALDMRQYPFTLRHNLSPQLVWLRSFHDIYNPSIVPYILEKLISTFPNIMVRMIGPDKGDGSQAHMTELAKKLKVQDHIQIIGQIPKNDVPNELNKGDIFLNTTNIDNSPVSVLEALACGLCTVSTNVGGIPYLLEHERDAILVPPNDADAMANAIQRLLNEPQLAKRISQAAHRKAEQHDWSIVFPMWEDLFKQVLNNH
jgi:glycosyltransferase involved in cell wall biosynthesis